MLALARVPISLDRLYESDDPGLQTFARAVLREVVRLHQEAKGT